jgi:hypothetical protein
VDGLRSLGFGTPPLPLQARLVVQLVGTTGSVTLFMAFLVFGKRRRDGEQTVPDDVLESNASSILSFPTAALVPEIANAMAPTAAPPLPGGALSPDELAMPRWRRPSLLQARKSDPLRSAPSQARLTFEHGAVDPVEGHERRLLRYRLVRLLDQPDELRGNEIGFLDEGDEVQILTRAGAYRLVLCPDGSRGWIHKMTLGEVVGEAPPPVRTADVGRSFRAAPARSAMPAFDAGVGATAAAFGGTGGFGDYVRSAGESRSRPGRGSVLGSATGGVGGFRPSGFAAETRARAEALADDSGNLDADVMSAFLSARRPR